MLRNIDERVAIALLSSDGEEIDGSFEGEAVRGVLYVELEQDWRCVLIYRCFYFAYTVFYDAPFDYHAP